MSDEKIRTVNVDGLSDNAIDSLQEAADAFKEGRGMWLLDDESYDRRIQKAKNVGRTIAFVSIAIADVILAIIAANAEDVGRTIAFLSTAIADVILAIIFANEDVIKNGLYKIIMFFTKK